MKNKWVQFKEGKVRIYTGIKPEGDNVFVLSEEKLSELSKTPPHLWKQAEFYTVEVPQKKSYVKIWLAVAIGLIAMYLLF